MTTTQTYTQLYRDTLLNDVIPFWQKHSIDQQDGGFFTCLDQKGTVYDTDKFVWLQARQVWTFSVLYTNLDAVPPGITSLEQRPDWLAIAEHGADFLKDTAGLTTEAGIFSTRRRYWSLWASNSKHVEERAITIRSSIRA